MGVAGMILNPSRASAIRPRSPLRTRARWLVRIGLATSLLALTATPALASERQPGHDPYVASSAGTVTLTVCSLPGLNAALTTLGNNGSLHIACSGTITLNSTIEVAAGSALYINAFGYSVTLSGGGTTRLFEVDGASGSTPAGHLSLSNLRLSDGYVHGAAGSTGSTGSNGSVATGSAPAGNGTGGGPGGAGGTAVGAAIFSAGFVMADDCYFTANQAVGGDGGAGGHGGTGGYGATGTPYLNGAAGGSGGLGGPGGSALGGAIYSSATLVLLDDHFSNNSATSGRGGAGGAGGSGGYGSAPGAVLQAGGHGGTAGSGGMGGQSGLARGGAVYSVGSGGVSIAATNLVSNNATAGPGGAGGAGGTGGRGGDGANIWGGTAYSASSGGNGGNGGAGGTGGTGGPAQGGAIFASTRAQLSAVDLISNMATAHAGGTGGTGGTGGAGGQEACGNPCGLHAYNGAGAGGGPGGSGGAGGPATGGAVYATGTLLEDSQLFWNGDQSTGGSGGTPGSGGAGGAGGHGGSVPAGGNGAPGVNGMTGTAGAGLNPNAYGTAAQGLEITTATLPNATPSVAYSASLATIGGTSPDIWSLISGSMPPGMTIDALSGAISGTPSGSGSYTFLIACNDGSAQWAARTYTIRLGPRGMSTYHPISPVRLLDTRSGNGHSGKLTAGTPVTFQVTGRADRSPVIPAGATAVTGNVTVTGSNAGWAVYLGPVPLPDPTTSTINFNAGQTAGNGLTVALSIQGTLSATFISSGGSTTDLVFDVTGYFTGDMSGDTFHPMDPVRELDTRSGNGLSGKLTANTPACFNVAGRNGVPASAKAVTGNVTAVAPSAAWAVYLGPVSTSSPSTSAVNFGAGEVAGNNLTTALDGAGRLCATYMGPSGAKTDLVFDVTGYYTADSAGVAFVPMKPVRVLDTRTGSGPTGRIAAHTPRTFAVVGAGSIPATATAVTGNVTVVNETAGWAVFLGPAANAAPSTSTINFVTGDVKGNGLTVALSATGTLSATYISTSGNNTDLVFDVTGYFVP